MKKLLTLLMIMGLGAGTVAAQHHKGGIGNHHQGKSRQAFAGQLKLTESQQKEMQKLRKEQQEKMQSLYNNDQLTLGEYKKQKEQLRKDYDAKRKSVFTPQQLEQLEKMKAERKAMKEVDAKARLEKMAIKLDLNAAQKEKMQGLQQSFREQADVIRANEAIGREEQKKQLKALAVKHKEAMGGVLSPAQQKVLEELKRRHQKHEAR
ncbi:hypothetical protein KJS94_09220 [Flavihumibacter rivuli]|uniref:hypothetical protein n=1 Tax=Flavihumibacter rivuli TaxID=2838156 RepID=UPI001BDEB245|nr:hypothetical protein [Flavihumibacter rivuli]ULQ58375.1 hypothetical protein KJS94_09220 [Flavihumibacter rivuli]